MIKVTYYEIDTGRILGSAICTEEDAINNKPENCEIFEGLVDNEFVYIQDNEIVHMPEKPGPYYQFDFILKEWINKETIDITEGLVKDKRNQLLIESDWTQLPDVSIENKQIWAVYRQELRDLTLQPNYPYNIIWPTPP
jgi:hypothetical protein